MNGRQPVVPESNGSKMEEDAAREILSRMTLHEKAAQMMLVSFRSWMPEGSPQTPPTVRNEDSGTYNVTALNGRLRDSLRKNRFGGVILYSENFRDAEQTVRLVSDMQEANRSGGGVPLLLAVDQEGGMVSRISFGTSGPGNRALGSTGDPENARRMGAIIGEELTLLRIHADFAPVLDVNSNPRNPVIGPRAFSDDAGIVAEYGLAFLEGLHSAGCLSAVKHFPGHGDTDTDSHTGLPQIGLPLDVLMEWELVPFRRAIASGADMVMTAHIQYPKVEPGTCPSRETGEPLFLPATMSRVFLTGLLRETLGFSGVIVTDALNMAAVAKNFRLEDLLRCAVNAGADLLILPYVRNEADLRLVEWMLEETVSLAERGEIDPRRIDESALRILRMKERCGLLGQTDFAATVARTSAAKAGVGSPEHLREAQRIAEKARL